jgi:hypothetical protein
MAGDLKQKPAVTPLMEEFSLFRLPDRQSAENKGPGCEPEGLIGILSPVSHQFDHIRLTKLPPGDDQVAVTAPQNCPGFRELADRFPSGRRTHNPTPSSTWTASGVPLPPKYMAGRVEEHEAGGRTEHSEYRWKKRRALLSKSFLCFQVQTLSGAPRRPSGTEPGKNPANADFENAYFVNCMGD